MQESCFAFRRCFHSPQTTPIPTGSYQGTPSKACRKRRSLVFAFRHCFSLTRTTHSQFETRKRTNAATRDSRHILFQRGRYRFVSGPAFEACRNEPRKDPALAAAHVHSSSALRSRSCDRRRPHIFRHHLNSRQTSHASVRSLRPPISTRSIRLSIARQIPPPRIRRNARPHPSFADGRCHDDNRESRPIHQRRIRLSCWKRTWSPSSLLAERILGDSNS